MLPARSFSVPPRMSFSGVCLVQSYSMRAPVSTLILGNRSPIWVIGPLVPILIWGNATQIRIITDEIVSAADQIVSVTDRKGKIMSEIQEIAQHIQDFPALVRKARMDKGITNEELTELSGISYSAVCKMQSGERDPKLYDAVAVMKAIGISADQVFDIQPPASAPSAMQERIHELELDNAVSSGDVVRLKQVNGLCTQRLDAVIRQRDYYKRWSVFSSIFAAILSLFLIVYLLFDFRNPHAGFILQNGPSAFAWLVILLVAISIGVCSVVGYCVLRDAGKKASLRK